MLMSGAQRVYAYSLQLALVIFPFSTAWVYYESMIGGVKWQYGTLLWYASEAVLVVCVMSCCLFLYTNHIRGKQVRFRWTKERLFVLSLAGLCAYLYGRSFFTVYPDIALQQSVHMLEAVLFFFCTLLSPLENRTLIRALVLGAIFQAGLGVAQFFLQNTWSSTLLGTSAHLAAEVGSSVVVAESERWLRAYGTLSHPNVFGGYLVLMLLLFLYIRSKAQNFTDIFNVRYQILNYLLIILLTVGVFVSFSRSAWIALFLGLLFLSFRSKQSKKHIVSIFTVICTFAILCGLLWPLITTRLGAKTLNERQSISERVSGNAEAIELAGENMLFGMGPGHYTVTLMQKDSSRPIWEYQPVHNVLLLVLVEIGVVGVLLFVLCSLLFVKTFQISFVDGVFFVPFVPLLLFDHYLWSSLVGLFVVGACIALFCRYKKVNTIA